MDRFGRWLRRAAEFGASLRSFLAKFLRPGGSGSAGGTSPFGQAPPDMPVVPIPLPETGGWRLEIGDSVLLGKLGELKQARRKAALWQGRRLGEDCFFALFPTEEKNPAWVAELLGGEEFLDRVSRQEVNSHQALPGLGFRFSSLSFQFRLDSRYSLRSRLYADEGKEAWAARDLELDRSVICVVFRPRDEGETSFAPRSQSDAACPGLLKPLREGRCRAVGPLAIYRNHYPEMTYVITDAPATSVPLSALLPARRLDLEQATSLLWQAGWVLHSLHAQGMVHGQVCPEHLWLAPEGGGFTVFVNGFCLFHGIRDTESSLYRSLYRKPPEVLLPYLAPEQLLEHSTTPKTDQFLLGLSVYQMVSGKNPFAASSQGAMKKLLTRCDIPPLGQVCPHVPLWFSSVVERMLMASPDARFADISIMIERLRRRCLDETHETSLAPRDVRGDEPLAEARTRGYLLCRPHQPFLLHKDRMFRIGRDRENDLVVASNDVSRFHATVIWKKDCFVLQDLQSSNGTEVNGRPAASCALSNADRIRIGGTEIVFQEAREEGEPNRPRRPLSLRDTSRIGTRLNAPVFSGDLAQISLWQILQMLATEKKSGGLAIASAEPIRIFFAEGRVVHCERGGEKGVEAFFGVLYLQEGSFEFSPQLAPEEITMSETVESLLFEGARRYDEHLREEC